MSELADRQFVTSAISAILQVGSGRRQPADTIPSDAMVHFRDEIARLLDASISAKTRAVYLQALKNFKDFNILIKLPDKLPVPSENILLYIVYHSSKGSVSLYIARFSYIHKLRRWRYPSNLFILKKAVEELRRLKRTKDFRTPILEELLIKVCSALHDVCISEYETLLFRAFFFLAFHGLFRAWELSYTSEQFAHVPLTILDIEFCTSKSVHCVFIHVRFSKNDQKGKEHLFYYHIFIKAIYAAKFLT